MPIPLDAHVAFNQRFNDDDHGGKWTLDGRDFIRTEMWRPLQSYHLYPRSPEEAARLCEACRGLVMAEQLESVYTPPVERRAHAKDCPGLDAIPIVAVGSNLHRRDGKTKNGTSYAFSTMFLERYKNIAYIAAAEDQAETLIEKKIGEKIRRHKQLESKAHITATKIVVPGKNSSLEVLPASHASVTGRGFALIIVDECRDLGARVFMALIASIFATHGVECPFGHGSWAVVEGGEAPPTECPHCGAALNRWYPRILAMSASGEKQDIAERDWFDDWIQRRIEKPQPGTRVFRSEKRLNPTVSKKVVVAVQRGFGDVPGLIPHLDVELGNKPLRRGEDYLRPDQVKAVVDFRLVDQNSSTRPAVAFLDTSKTGDKTCLVVCVDDSMKYGCATCGYRGEESPDDWHVNPGTKMECRARLEPPPPFERMALQHLVVWDPHDKESCPSGIVDPDAVEKHLDRVMPRFTRLLKLSVDVRVMPWAKLLVQRCSRKDWGRGRISPFAGGAMENSMMYVELQKRIVGKTLRIPNDKGLLDELESLRKVDLAGGGLKVTDAHADKSGRARKSGAIHRDRAMALAGCCLDAAEALLSVRDPLDSVDEIEAELDRVMDEPVMSSVVRGKA